MRGDKGRCSATAGNETKGGNDSSIERSGGDRTSPVKFNSLAAAEGLSVSPRPRIITGVIRDKTNATITFRPGRFLGAI